jgi:hypothetical protein
MIKAMRHSNQVDALTKSALAVFALVVAIAAAAS